MVLDHGVTITGLEPGTTYLFRVGSVDANGNGPKASVEKEFTTSTDIDETAPQISNLSIQSIAGDTAVVTWNTDEPGNSQVRYDTDSRLWENYAYSENDAGMKTQHRVILTRLSPSKLYYIRVSSTDASGNNHATSSTDVNPSWEFPMTTGTEDPPSIVVYPDANYPKVDPAGNTIEITYDEPNMQHAEIEGNYILSPALTFADPGNSIALVSTAGGQSTYRMTFTAVEAYTVYSLTVTDNITDADGYRVQPNSVLINDNDADDLPDDWEVEYGLNPASGNASIGQGRDGDLDGDGFVNFEEFINNTDPTDEASFPSPPNISQVIPHDEAGLADVFRVPNDSSFAIYISDSTGIDINTATSVVLSIDDGTNAVYEVDLGDLQVVRAIKMDATNPDAAVRELWVVYDRSLDSYGVFPFDAVINVTATVTNINGERKGEDYTFKVETEIEHANATVTGQLPAFEVLEAGDSAFTDSEHTYDAGFQLTEGALAGAKLVYNLADIEPQLGPTGELPVFNANAAAVGDAINLQPPNVFSTPIKLVLPTPGITNVNNLSVYLYDGTQWVLGCDASGNSPVDGWLVPGSRVNAGGSIQLKIRHFSGIQIAAAIPTQVGGGGEDAEVPQEDDVGSCFIKTLGF
jgi:hypothetical protein